MNRGLQLRPCHSGCLHSSHWESSSSCSEGRLIDDAVTGVVPKFSDLLVIFKDTDILGQNSKLVVTLISSNRCAKPCELHSSQFY